jgi:hypothetical protein
VRYVHRYRDDQERVRNDQPQRAAACSRVWSRVRRKQRFLLGCRQD